MAPIEDQTVVKNKFINDSNLASSNSTTSQKGTSINDFLMAGPEEIKNNTQTYTSKPVEIQGQTMTFTQSVPPLVNPVTNEPQAIPPLQDINNQ